MIAARSVPALVFVALLTARACAEQERHPLEAADTSSPRATLRSFLDAGNEAYELIRKQGGLRYKSNTDIVPAAERFLDCLDLSQVPPAFRMHAGSEAAVCLKEVLDRIELPPEADIPGADEVNGAEGGPGVRRWSIPPTEITIAQMTEGPRTGEFLFTPGTIDQIQKYYRRVEDLPYKPGASEGFYHWYLSEPGWMIPSAWIRSLPDWTRHRVWGMTVWQWVGLVMVPAAGAAVMIATYRVGQRFAQGQDTPSALRYVLAIGFPIAAMLVPPCVEYLVVAQLVVRGTAMAVVSTALNVLFLAAVVVVVMGASNRIAAAVIASPKIHPRGIDAQLIRLGFRVLAITAAVVVMLEGGQALGIPLTTLLAGAGVGGLAIALAAQDTLRSVFGSMMILLDKPYRVGERIVAKGYDGVVQDVGLRSTQIRLLTGHMASIPNEEMAKIDVENIGRRQHIRRKQDVALAFDTPPAKVQEAVEIVRDLLDEHEGMSPDFPPRVHFNQFNRDSLNLRIMYWYQPPDYWQFSAFSERLNLEMMQKFEAEGIHLAVPATATHITTENEQAPTPIGPEGE